jgi:hypothetical protein
MGAAAQAHAGQQGSQCEPICALSLHRVPSFGFFDLWKWSLRIKQAWCQSEKPFQINDLLIKSTESVADCKNRRHDCPAACPLS